MFRVDETSDSLETIIHNNPDMIIDDTIETSIDPICYLHMDEGECNQSIERIYYNSESGQCETFMYSGKLIKERTVGN